MALVVCDVVGPLPIVDAVTGKDVTAGPVVLDDERTVIHVLVTAGLVTPPQPFEASKPKPGKG